MADDVYTYVGLTGTVVGDTSDIQAQVEAEFIAAFGADFVTTPDTPNGVLITTETLARSAVADNNAQLANQINPDYAGGVFLDALMLLLGTPRQLGTPTVVSVVLSGVQTSIINAGTLLQDSVHNILFQTTATVILDSITGNATVNAQAVSPGSVQIAPGTLTQLVEPIPTGLETVTNPAAQIIIGTDEQTDAQAGVYRRETLAGEGSSLSQAITTAVRSVPGVKSLSFIENYTGAPVVITGVITMVANSIYLCVYGGVDAAVAAAIDSKKSGGCAYNNGATGATPVSVPITDPYSGQIKNILFDRPAVIPVIVVVTVRANPEIQNPQALVAQAINDYAAGLLSQEPGLTVGTAVSAFELAGAINREIPGIFVENVQISAAGGTPSYVIYFPITKAQVAQINSITTTVVTT